VFSLFVFCFQKEWVLLGNGSDKFSVVDSGLTFARFLFGIYFVFTFNNSASMPFFGMVSVISLGVGTYLLPIVAADYLLLKKLINNISF